MPQDKPKTPLQIFLESRGQENVDEFGVETIDLDQEGQVIQPSFQENFNRPVTSFFEGYLRTAEWFSGLPVGLQLFLAFSGLICVVSLMTWDTIRTTRS